MSNFYTRECMAEKNFEITFGTDNREDFEAVQELCRKLIGHSKSEQKDCRDCVHWNDCPCGKTGHEKGTSIGYSIGECKEYSRKIF